MFWTLNTSSETKERILFQIFAGYENTRGMTDLSTFAQMHQCLSVIVLFFFNAIQVHPKLRNINFHNATHSLISRNPRERMFVVQISLFIVTFSPYITKFVINANHKRSQLLHPRIAPCVNMWSATFLCHLLNVGACICHIVHEGKVEWTTPHH
jgi:hypothetical protein